MSQRYPDLSCTKCDDPFPSYILNGIKKCTCGGYIVSKDDSFDIALRIRELQETDKRIAERSRFETEWPHLAAGRDTRDAERLRLSRKDRGLPIATRLNTFRRFKLEKSNTLMFECGGCGVLRDSKTMMRFDDKDAPIGDDRDWCGRCVKKEIIMAAKNKAEWKKIWELVKLGASISKEELDERLPETRGPVAAPTGSVMQLPKPRVRMKLPKEPAPELMLVL